MKKLFTNSLVLATAICLTALDAKAEKTTETGGSMAVFVYNRAEVPGAIVEEALQAASRILGRAGVPTVWYDGRRASSDAAVAAAWENAHRVRRLVIHIIPAALAPQGRFTEANLGFATIGSGTLPTQAYIFYDRVTQTAADFGCPVDTLFAHSLAHEIGHLLMGVRSHSSRGIMRGVWRTKDIERARTGDLGFGAEEAHRMAARIQGQAD